MTKTVKVLHVLNGLSSAGIENFALQLIKHSPPSFECKLLNLDPESQELYPRFQSLIQHQHLSEIISIQSNWHLLFAQLFHIGSLYKPDAVIVYPCNFSIVSIVLGLRLAGVTSISVCVQNTAPGTGLLRQKWRILLNLLSVLGAKLVSCSEAVADSIRPLLISHLHLPVIPNGCDLQSFTLSALSSSCALPGPSSAEVKRVGMVARLDKIKDQATLIKAFALVSNPSWQLHLVGDGPSRTNLEDLASQCGLDPRIVFLGRRLDIPEILNNLDIFAFSTTESEGFGIVLIEAMAAGIPIIASDVPACREVLANGSAGVLVKPGVVDEWAKSLDLIMSSISIRASLSHKSRLRASYYDIRTIAQHWYDELLS